MRHLSVIVVIRDRTLFNISFILNNLSILYINQKDLYVIVIFYINFAINKLNCINYLLNKNDLLYVKN